MRRDTGARPEQLLPAAREAGALRKAGVHDLGMRGIGLLEPSQARRLRVRETVEGQSAAIAIEAGARKDGLCLVMTNDKAQQPAHV